MWQTETPILMAPWLPWVEQYHSPDDARVYVLRARARWLLREDLAVGILHRDGTFLGGSGLHRMNWTLRTFDHLQANRVEIRMDPENVHTRRVAERLGFVLEGTPRRVGPEMAGRLTDRHVFALIPEDYRRLDWAQGTER